MRDIVKRIKDNEHQIIQKREFKEEEFIVLRNITCKEESSISLVIHCDSLHIYAMKKIKNIKHKTKEIEHEIDFCSNYSHRVFTPFYGFVKSENNDDIIGFIYKYMSNNSLSSYLSSKKAYKEKDEDDIFIMTTILRISSGIEYLQSKSLIHRDLKPSNILLDHDFIPYISDFETIRSINDESKSTPMTNDLGSLRYTSPEQDDGKELTYATDIYSFGLIIYFLYEQENMYDTNLISIFDKKRNYNIKSIQKSSTKMNNLYKKCVKYEQTARPTIDEIKTITIDEIESYCYFQQYFNLIGTDDNFQLALQFMYENILISIDNTEKSDTHFKSIMIKRDYLDAKKYFMLLTKDNGSDAFKNLGTIYYYGKGVKQNYLKAKNFYELSAKQNNSDAFNYLGNLYQYGEGVKRDYLKAKEYYELSAKQNNSHAFIKLGDLYHSGEGVEQDYLKAKEYYELSAKQNNSHAFIKLGDLYYSGEGVKQDYLKAKEYYELSAKQNNSDAFFNLGYLYQSGLGVAKDYLKAKKYNELSAKKGNSFAYFVLGNFYHDGLGVDKNYKVAKKYYEMAAKKGNYLAYIQLGDMYFKGEGVEQDYIKARNFYEVTAVINNMDALFKLGVIYLNGYGVERDYHKAIKYFELSAKQNNADALFFLGMHYSSNEICDRNISKSIENYLKCIQIERGDIVMHSSKEKTKARTFKNNRYRHRAMNDLGLIYLLDFEDFEKGNEYIKESAFSEYPFGQNNFGLINEIYLGEILKAEHFYERSSEHCFSLAEYNLGYLKEKSGREEESIEYYIKASEYEDKPLIFRNIEHQDTRLTISKTFVVCFTNLKLFEYYFNKGNSDESRKYFIKSFSKLTIKEKDEEYSYQFELRFDHNDVQKSISYLKTFIFNFPSFNLFNQPSLKTILQYLKIKNENDQENKHQKRSKKSKKSKRKTESVKNHSIHRAMKEENFYHKIKLSNMIENEEHEDEEDEEIGGCANEGVTIFSDPGEFIDFVYKNEQQKTILIESIRDIIQSMKEILYTPPYVILFGRLHIRKRKDCYKEINELFPHQKEINELFYEGLDIEEFHYHKT
ncbi:hypothetical protein M9Y10_042620 [Tritrichomonas musculus]|uniref:Protein kinase domain-containing protein n=1 Tax=Tritrichomonas musculus TaxID=1915356 RepID=A0ABR2JY33_9EUKA